MQNLRMKLTLYSLLVFLNSMVFNTNLILAKQLSQPYINGGQLLGSARMSYLFWDIYDIKLFTTSGEWSVDGVFALELQYLRNLDGKAIAERSIEEMEGQGLRDAEKIQRWFSEMKAIFPDVDDKTTLVALKNNNGFTEFLRNGELIGVVKDKEFTQRFFDIWLGEKTTEPKLRKKLLGDKA